MTMTQLRNIRSVLVANRGEIAVRVMRTLARLDVRSVAVYSDADAEALHVAIADSAVYLGPTAAQDSYLNVDRVISAALASGADAIHPGYGFLSENTRLAQACVDNGIVFIGPPAAVIEQMGDKIQAKVTAIEAGVPVVPGRHDPAMSDAQVTEAVLAIGFPSLLKPSAGGGGKGMRIIRTSDEIAGAIESARRESLGAFGDDTLLVERFVDQPRHIEVQVLADTHGNVVHLGERECSLQRRHQKVIEESPSPLLDDHARQAICAAAVRLAQSVNYVGAGTVEFVVPASAPMDFAFLEMNTRLQVEHPVTEAVTGIDLVAEQIRIADGQPLGYDQGDIHFCGVAIEARIYAEDPLRESLPTGGLIEVWEEPEGIRVDSGVRAGDIVTSHYDPMLAKVISAGADRTIAMRTLASALSSMVIFGVVTNVDYLRQILADERVQAGDLDTNLLSLITAESLWEATGPPPMAAAAIVNVVRSSLPMDSDVWSRRDGWRIGAEEPLRIDWTESGSTWPLAALADDPGEAIDDDATIWLDGDAMWFHSPGQGIHRGHVSWPIDRRLRQPAHTAGQTGIWTARSPMPGMIVNMGVSVGDRVEAGHTLVSVEAMKMEHAVRAPGSGVVQAIDVAVGQQVTLDQQLVEIALGDDDEGGSHDDQ